MNVIKWLSGWCAWGEVGKNCLLTPVYRAGGSWRKEEDRDSTLPPIVQGPQVGGRGWSYPATHDRDTMILELGTHIRASYKVRNLG